MGHHADALDAVIGLETEIGFVAFGDSFKVMMVR
jgi:hypothetical protein